MVPPWGQAIKKCIICIRITTPMKSSSALHYALVVLTGQWSNPPPRRHRPFPLLPAPMPLPRQARAGRKSKISWAWTNSGEGEGQFPNTHTYKHNLLLVLAYSFACIDKPCPWTRYVLVFKVPFRSLFKSWLCCFLGLWLWTSQWDYNLSRPVILKLESVWISITQGALLKLRLLAPTARDCDSVGLGWY